MFAKNNSVYNFQVNLVIFADTVGAKRAEATTPF